ncbi:MAG: YkgJ family cysteine cluster protein [Candidatus Omnitrophota bacterium]
MIKQFVPSRACLKCQGCCRFKEEDSVWSPCLLDEEVQDFLDKNIPAASISVDRRLQLIPNSAGEGFICPFLNSADNCCKVYDSRPFECQLYPFLIKLCNGKVLLTVDLNCPYVNEKMSTPEMDEYINYLTAHLNSKQQLTMLKNNPQITQAYEDVQDILELEI